MSEWISPTSHGGTWYSDPEYSYDGNTGTYAVLQRENIATLYPPSPILCSKIRLWASVLTVTRADLTVSVYYSGGYNEIFDGQVSTYTDWVEIAIGSTQTVEHVKIVPHTIVLSDCLHEFEFWKEGDVPPAETTGMGAFRAANIFRRM
ncbi:MAG: hypothetical protein PHQ43_13690 [Dehalococcoidales bacterium]|nr:hypothetical protein [Dehalococcoidales bacterium]